MLPKEFVNLMTNQLGKDQAELLCHALTDTDSPTSIRMNKQKISEYEDKENVETQVPWCEEGLYLKTRPSFTFDPLLHAGCYYVQEASSMYISHILKTYLGEQPIVALDMCAAPGGKSTLTLSELPEGSLLIANEVMRQRAQILSENITKWGNPNCIVTSNYAEDFVSLGEIFDLIICDAPCSGEGMFRKDQGAIDDWSLDNVDTCWKRQRDILTNIWQCLKPNGLLIYSTCTFNSLEDEENVDWIIKELGGEKLSINEKGEWNITNGHFFPHKTKGEGFFVSAIRKTAEENEDNSSYYENKKLKKQKTKNAKKQKPVIIPKDIKEWIVNSSEFTFIAEGDNYISFPSQHIDIYNQAKENLRIISAGIEIATLKGKNLQPQHGLALSTKLNKTIFPCVELSLEDAIAYLRTEAIQVDAPKGYIILTYKGHPLGFGKNIGNRVNNLYPSEWRIRKAL